MAVKNLESLVLHGVTVATEVVTGLVRIGSKTANGQTPAMALSHSRHPSHSDCGSDPDTRPCSGGAEGIGAAPAVERAGRPGAALVSSPVEASREPRGGPSYQDGPWPWKYLIPPRPVMPADLGRACRWEWIRSASSVPNLIRQGVYSAAACQAGPWPQTPGNAEYSNGSGPGPARGRLRLRCGERRSDDMATQQATEAGSKKL
jgi:hypothetical protein